MGVFLQPLDDVINQKLLPAILGTNTIQEQERNLYVLPIRSGGLGIPIFTDKAGYDFNTSRPITAQLSAIMVTQT